MAAAQTVSKGVVLGEELVAQIARTEPGFAEAVSFIRKRTELLAGGYAKIYLLPKGTEPPVRAAASKDGDAFSILARLDEQDGDAPSVEPAVYEVTLDGAGDSAFATLKINSSSRKPGVAPQSLTINLMKAERGKWKVSGWNI